MTRGPCRRRTGEALPRAEKFGDLITTYHNVLNEEGESRNNHRYAVVVQDLATQRILSYPCRAKTSQETEKSFRKFLEPSQKTKKLLARTIHWKLASLVKFFHGIIEIQHLIDPKRTALLERALRRVKEGTSAVLLQSGLDETWWSASRECCCYLRNAQYLLADGKNTFCKAARRTILRPSDSMWEQ